MNGFADIMKAYVEERDKVLLSGDIDLLIRFHQKHNPDQRPMDQTVAEVSLHKARTAALSLPLDVRMESKRWLARRGYTSMDGGTLPATEAP